MGGWLAGGCWWWFRWSGCAYREVKEKDGGGGVSPKVARVGACSAGFSVFGFVGFVRSLQTMPPTVFSFPDCYQRALRGGWRLLSSISRDYLSLSFSLSLTLTLLPLLSFFSLAVTSLARIARRALLK